MVNKPDSKGIPLAAASSVGLPSRQSGFLYVEVLVATLLIAISLAPAIDALQPGIQGSVIHTSLTIDHYELAAKMETLLSEPFSQLLSVADATGNPAAATTYSDSIISTDGRTLDRIVYLSRYDGDNADTDNNGFTGTDDYLLWIKVEIKGTGQILESLSSAY